MNPRETIAPSGASDDRTKAAPSIVPALIRDPEFGYTKVEPAPNSGALRDFYREHYLALLGDGGRSRAMTLPPHTPESLAEEAEWRRQTLFADIVDGLHRWAPGRRVLDVGCAGGDLLDYLREQAYTPVGIEPSAEMVEALRRRGHEAHVGFFEEYARAPNTGGRHDAIVFLNVLEHVADPKATLEQAHRLLAPGGVLVVRVPNDFSELQKAALAACGLPNPWWVCVPDHLSYFSRSSLEALLGATGFEVLECTADFPMELFLLMGEDYVSDPLTGRQVHARRRRMELRLPAELRRTMYRALAGADIGRNLLVFAQKRSAEHDSVPHPHENEGL